MRAWTPPRNGRPRPGSDVTPLEREFIGASVKQSEAELEAVSGRANAEAAGRRRTQRLATGLAAALVLALLAAGFAVRYQRSADSRATDAKTARTGSRRQPARCSVHHGAIAGSLAAAGCGRGPDC